MLSSLLAPSGILAILPSLLLAKGVMEIVRCGKWKQGKSLFEEEESSEDTPNGQSTRS